MRVTARSSTPRATRALQEALADAGVAATGLVGPGAGRALPEDVAVLDGSPEARAWALAQAASLARSAQPPAAIVAASRFAAPPPEGDECHVHAWLQLDAPAGLLAREMQAVQRAASARAELAHRRRTASELGFEVEPTGGPPAMRTLFIGEPHPYFLALERELGAQGGRLEAAFSSFMGFDFLHDDRFDAVVLNACADAATALALCGALRRNARLHHLPTIMLTGTNGPDFASSAIERGAGLLIGPGASHDAAIRWTFEKIARGRREARVENCLAATRDTCVAPSSLFLPAFFEAHLARLADAAHASGRALSVAGLRVQLAAGARRATASGWRRGLYQVCEIAGRLIRSEDTAALLDGDLIVIALPGAGAAEARRTAERVASVTECTAFAAGEADAGPIVLEQTAAELAAGESGAGLLARTRAAFELEGARA